MNDKIAINLLLVSIIMSAVVFVMIGISLIFSIVTSVEQKPSCDCTHNQTEPQIVQNQMQKEYEGFTTVEIEDPYFVEVENGYITEESLKSICQYIGDMYDIPPALLQAVAWVESNYKVDARGSSGDSGLCQVIPGYHLARMEKLGVTDIMDPYGNVLVAADLINDISNEWYKDRSAVDWGYVIMHYNQGYNAKESYQQYGLSSHAQKVMSKYYEIIGG